jgi:hypothetical protein
MILDINNMANKTNSHETMTSIKVKPFSVIFFFSGILYSPHRGGINFDAKRFIWAKAFIIKVFFIRGVILAQLLFTLKKLKCKQSFTLLPAATDGLFFVNPFPIMVLGQESVRGPGFGIILDSGKAGGFK